ncbi:MAG: hypothetical protein H0U75_07000 [Legionella sp.]|nr:hypothetical protein [Legionella sp.]
MQEHVAKSREHYSKAIDHLCGESNEGPEISRRKALDKLNQDKNLAPNIREIKYTLEQFNYLDSLAAHFTKIAKQYQDEYPNESGQLLQAIDTAYHKFSIAKVGSWDYTGQPRLNLIPL